MAAGDKADSRGGRDGHTLLGWKTAARKGLPSRGSWLPPQQRRESPPALGPAGACGPPNPGLQPLISPITVTGRTKYVQSVTCSWHCQ